MYSRKASELYRLRHNLLALKFNNSAQLPESLTHNGVISGSCTDPSILF